MEMIVRLKESMQGVVLTPFYPHLASGSKQTLLKDVKEINPPAIDNNGKSGDVLGSK